MCPRFFIRVTEAGPAHGLTDHSPSSIGAPQALCLQQPHSELTYGDAKLHLAAPLSPAAICLVFTSPSTLDVQLGYLADFFLDRYIFRREVGGRGAGCPWTWT